MDSRQGLPRNTVIDGSYRIERIIGSGGFGVTYQAEDIKLKTTIALKEYYPADFGERDRTMHVRPKSERHKTTFEWGRSSFLQEAQMLARFRHPSIVRVTRVLEANSTAYMVMDFEQGQSFEAWLASLGRPPTQAELDRIAAPLLDALEVMHRASFLHRDIAPDNIVIRTDGTPVLLDFGAARRAVAEVSRALTGIVKAGYSPHEQYATDGRLQGPWTDLYALAATLYRAVDGRPPEEATLRMSDDRMRPATAVGKGRYRPGFLAALDACLAVVQSKRPQSVAALRPLLLAETQAPVAGAQCSEAAPKAPAPGTTAVRPSARQWVGIAFAALALLAGAWGGLEYTRRQSHGVVDADIRRSAEAEARRKADAEAALDAEVRRKEEERRREAALEEARRQEENARREAEAREAARREEEAREAARRKAEVEAEARRRAEQEANAARKKTEEEAPNSAPAPSTEPIRVAAPSSWGKDCVPDPIPQVTVISAPKHGSIEFAEGTTRPNRVLKGNVKCIGTEQKARIVSYRPLGTPVESDQVSLSVLNVRGQRYVIDCTVRVVERKSECKARK